MPSLAGGVLILGTRDQHTTVPWEGLRGSERHAACLTAGRAGDRRALATLVEDLTPLIWHVARRCGLTSTDSEDVVQTVWLAMFAHIDRLSEPKALAGWLVTTSRREAQRLLAKSVTTVPLTDELTETMVSEAEGPEDLAVRADRDARLWRAFDKLSERDKTLLRHTVLAGRVEYRLVAKAMNLSHGSVGPTRARVLNRLRDLLAQENEDNTLVPDSSR